jgi:hypothetical protein
LLREQAHVEAGDAFLHLRERSDVSAALISISGTKSMIFLQYQLKALTRHSRPGVQHPAIAILPNIHKLRDIKPKKARHQYKRPGQINVSENLFIGNLRVGAGFASLLEHQDQHIPRGKRRSTHTVTRRRGCHEGAQRLTARLGPLAYAPNRRWYSQSPQAADALDVHR